MADIELVIKIPEEILSKIDDENYQNVISWYVTTLYCAIKDGTPLPKGHGDLIDRKELLKQPMNTANYPTNYVNIAPTIIEADRAESDEVMTVKEFRDDLNGRKRGKMNLNEFHKWLERQSLEDKLVYMRYKYSLEDRWTYSNEYLKVDTDAEGYVSNSSYIWLNNWNKGQEYVEILGCIDVYDIHIPVFKVQEESEE